MTEKRFRKVLGFIADYDGECYEEGENFELLDLTGIENRLNELHEENQHLRQILDLGQTNAKDVVDVLNIQQAKISTILKENKELSEQVKYLKKQVKIFRGECNRLTKENTELLEELND